MKTKVYFCFLMFACMGIIILSSCKKHKQPVSNQNSVKEKLVEKRWGITAVVLENPVDINGDGTADTDVYAIRYKGTCREDDYRRFIADGSLVVSDGGFKCTDAARPTWTWTLSSDNKELVMMSSFDKVETWTIISITDSQLKVKYIETQLFSQPQTVLVTFSLL